MKFTITDYDGEETICEIPNERTIKLIVVTILTGDEIVDVVLDDGTIMSFDSSIYRMMNDYDGHYVVTKQRLDEWFALSDETSYGRMKKFLEKEDNSDD